MKIRKEFKAKYGLAVVDACRNYNQACRAVERVKRPRDRKLWVRAAAATALYEVCQTHGVPYALVALQLCGLFKSEIDADLQADKVRRKATFVVPVKAVS